MRDSRTLAARALAAGALCALILGCAAPVNIQRSIDPLEILGPGALVYARLDGEAARSLAPAMLPAEQGKAIAPLLKRTDSMAFALGSAPAPDPSSTRAEGTGPGAAAPGPGTAADRAAAARPLAALEAVFIGDYPFRMAGLVLGSQPGWKKDGEAFANAATGIRAAVPGPSVMLATTGDYKQLLAQVRTPPGSPIPRRLEAFASKQLLVWVPDPFKGLASVFVGESMNVPAQGLLISATRKAAPAGAPALAGAERAYVLTVAFAMSDAGTARIFRPAFRLAWYVIAKSLLSEEADSALALKFALDGELYWASGLELKESTLAAALGRLSAGMK